MKTIITVASILLAALIATTIASAQEKISGTYSVYVGGAVIEQDKYEYTPGKEYKDEITADTQKVTMSIGYDGGTFAGFERQVNGLPGSAVKLNKVMLSFYEGTGMVGVLSNEEQFPVFEPTSYAEYAMFGGMLYDQQKGGRQSTKVVIPALQDFLPVEIERHGTDEFALTTGTVTAAHYRVALGKKKETVNLWMDGARLMAAYIGSSNKFVVDTRYAQLYDRVKQLINKAM